MDQILRPLYDSYGSQYNLGLTGLSGILLITVFTAIAAVVIYAKNFYREEPRPGRDPSLPTGSEVVSLRIYPIKSCRGIELRSVKVKRSGLDLDRNWMFVDPAKGNEFLTIRGDPSMTLIDTELTNDWKELKISIKGTEDSVTIPTRPTKEWLESNTKLVEVEIWGKKTDGWEYSDDINRIFNTFFKKPVKLVYKGPTPRPSGGNADPEFYGETVPHHFADLMSVQIASEASLEDLNRRLKDRDQEELTIERFRPNIIVKGNEPWEEDRWKRVQIITMFHELEQLRRLDFDVVCHCARCQVPNVNPDTADKHAKEPWDTLMKFRRIDEGGAAKYKPCFGMLCLPKGEGEIRLGSKLEALEMTDKHLYSKAKFADL